MEWDQSEVGGTQGTWGSGIEIQSSGAGGKCLEGRDPPESKSPLSKPRPSQNSTSEGTASRLCLPKW